jgi:mannose-6-phosphate isomerase-like protein (cupin superfamily)
MRRLVIGMDADGHSGVIEEATFPAPADAPSTELIHQTATAPPPVRPPGSAAHVDLEVAPGIARWILVQFQPGQQSFMHHTDSIDFHTIVSGGVDILLDDGPHHLEPGDCVVVGGVDHAWLAGPEGCTSSVVVIGTPPRD